MPQSDPAICPTCNLPTARCLCRLSGRISLGQTSIETPSPSKPSKSDKATLKGDGIVRIGRATKGRRGKGVTTVTGIPLSGDALKEVAQTLKGKCGAGGTVKDGVIEIQGEHRELLQKSLETLGYRVKQSGG